MARQGCRPNQNSHVDLENLLSTAAWWWLFTAGAKAVAEAQRDAKAIIVFMMMMMLLCLVLEMEFGTDPACVEEWKKSAGVGGDRKK